MYCQKQEEQKILIKNRIFFIHATLYISRFDLLVVSSLEMKHDYKAESELDCTPSLHILFILFDYDVNDSS